MVWVGRVSDGSRVGCRTVVVSVRVSLGGMPRHDTHIRNSSEHCHYPLISILAYLIYQGKHPSARPIHYLNTLLYILQRQSLLGDYPTRLQKLRQLFAAILYIRNLQEATVKATIAEQTVTLHINALNVPEPDELPSDSEPEQ